MIIITAKVRLKEDAVDEFIDAYRWMHPQVMKDPGAILYSLHRSTEDPNEFLFYEKYEDEDAFAYHLSTEHFKTLSGRIDPLMAAPPEIGKWVVMEEG
jgi:autoinducer 2-degrading protein